MIDLYFEMMIVNEINSNKLRSLLYHLEDMCLPSFFKEREILTSIIERNDEFLTELEKKEIELVKFTEK